MFNNKITFMNRFNLQCGKQDIIFQLFGSFSKL